MLTVCSCVCPTNLALVLREKWKSTNDAGQFQFYSPSPALLDSPSLSLAHFWLGVSHDNVSMGSCIRNWFIPKMEFNCPHLFLSAAKWHPELSEKVSV